MISSNAPFPARTDNFVPAEPSVSLARLRHKPPRKAIKFFVHALKLVHAGQWQDGINEFERATAIDPQFSEAYGNLGASLFVLGRAEEAVGDFRRAIELDPATGVHHMNLGYALLGLDRAKEAEPEARTAVALDPANANAHYLLGVLFARRAETRSGAIQHLVYAARTIPEAHFILAQLYGLDGDTRAANQEMAQYNRQSAELQQGSR